MFPDITGIILTGGESKRMGRNKASIEIDGISLTLRTAELFRKIFLEVIIVSREAGRLGNLGCREVVDMFTGRGPMVGILTALSVARTGYIFTAACDMPFLNRDVISLIINSGKGLDVALPEAGGQTHPLPALYSKRCYGEMKASMERGERSLNRFIEGLPAGRVRYVKEEEIREIDPDIISLFNMNTPEELERAKKLAEKWG